MSKLEQYREQMKKQAIGTSAYNRTDIYRDYTGRGLWLFYLALKPNEVKRLQRMKKGQFKSEKENIRAALFNAIFNNGQYPFKVVGVKGDSYDLINVGGSGLEPEALITKCYDTLLKSAIEEIKAEHSGLGSDALGLNLIISNHQISDTEIKNDFVEYVMSIFKPVLAAMGNNYDFSSLLSNSKITAITSRIKNDPKSLDLLYENLRNMIIGALFETSSIKNSEIINSFGTSEEIDEIIKVLISKRRPQDIQMELGKLAEKIVTNLLIYFNNNMSQAQKNSKAYILDQIKHTGQDSASTKFFKIDKTGKAPEKTLTETKVFFITPDITIHILEKNNPSGSNKLNLKELKISLKTPSNMDKIIYKTAKAKNEADNWTRTANWNHVLQTFIAFSVFNRTANAQFKLYQILASAIASIGIAGTAEHRALITIAMTKGNMKIRSLDTILKEMRDNQQARLTMNEIRVKNREMYVSNARVIASSRVNGTNGPYSTINPNLIETEMYQKYSDLKELHLNYILATKPIK